MALHATIVPNGTTRAGSWTIGGGSASLHAAVADASDATYAQSNVVDDKLILSLGDIPALAAGQVVTHVTLFVRASMGIPGGGNIRLWLVDAAGFGPGNALGPLDSVVTEASQTYVDINGPLTEAKVNGLQLVAVGSDVAITLLHRAYVEVWTNTPPSATPLATDPTTVTTITVPGEPYRNWNYSDADGDPQEQAHVKLFHGSAAVVDPETEVARLVADGGAITYSGTIFALGAWPNDSYIWAVKAKDAYGWGPWGQRSIIYALPVPAPPLLTAVPDPGLNIYTVTVNHQADVYATEFFQIQRSEDSGVTWLTFYGGDNVPFSGSAVVLSDWRSPRMARSYTASTTTPIGYNAVLGYNAAVGYNGVITAGATGPINVVRYRARSGRLLNGVKVWSGWTTITPENLVGDGTMWLKHPTDYTKSILLQQVANWETTSEEDMAILRAANRQDFVVFAGVPSWKKGELELIFSSDAAYQAFENLRAPKTTVQALDATLGSQTPAAPTSYLFQSCFGDTALEQVWMRLGPTLSTTRVTTGPQQHTNQYRRVKIGFVETKIPTA